MNAASFEIIYHFTLPDHSATTVELCIDAEQLNLLNELPRPLPSWTMLGFHQCPNCTLDAQTSAICPVAAHLVQILPSCNKLISYDEVDVEVVTSERKISVHTKAEMAISAMMGLIFATSGCPHMDFFRPMARFHLPFATQEETLFRSTGTYLLGQYLRQRQGHEPDFDLSGLEAIYEEIKTINLSVAARLRAATKTDSALNALVLLDIHAQILPYALKTFLDKLDYLFMPFWMSQCR
ncbi:MAG: hypothetical protein K0A93_01200 [Desulfuromonadaceae bacterium]|nr:hypothetical protein [Desulfuromonadaceae bacterium]